MEVQKVLYLSTAHMPETEPDFEKWRVAEHEYGYVVFCCPFLAQRGKPDWLKPIMDFAIAEKCLLINFDSAAEVMAQFKTYEW